MTPEELEQQKEQQAMAGDPALNSAVNPREQHGLASVGGAYRAQTAPGDPAAENSAMVSDSGNTGQTPYRGFGGLLPEGIVRDFSVPVRTPLPVSTDLSAIMPYVMPINLRLRRVESVLDQILQHMSTSIHSPISPEDVVALQQFLRDGDVSD